MSQRYQRLTLRQFPDFCSHQLYIIFQIDVYLHLYTFKDRIWFILTYHSHFFFVRYHKHPLCFLFIHASLELFFGRPRGDLLKWYDWFLVGKPTSPHKSIIDYNCTNTCMIYFNSGCWTARPFTNHFFLSWCLALWVQVDGFGCNHTC